ncbi:MAG: hypothetical protein A2078_04745 [Nitrospirae bacterium GWC2_57_9]|nr:MAG: hypothetical protein A2078_04745 [Nitrospirae bacterium GWC2_57_9]
MVFKLMDRGLTGDQIHRAMKHMVGPDWREVTVSVWLERLRIQGYVLHDERSLTAGDLEALVKGRIALEQLNRNGHGFE